MNKRHYEHTLPNIRGSLSNTYTTATVHGPEWEEDKAVYRFKTTIGVKG